MFGDLRSFLPVATPSTPSRTWNWQLMNFGARQPFSLNFVAVELYRQPFCRYSSFLHRLQSPRWMVNSSNTLWSPSAIIWTFTSFNLSTVDSIFFIRCWGLWPDTCRKCTWPTFTNKARLQVVFHTGGFLGYSSVDSWLTWGCGFNAFSGKLLEHRCCLIGRHLWDFFVTKPHWRAYVSMLYLEQIGITELLSIEIVAYIALLHLDGWMVLALAGLPIE